MTTKSFNELAKGIADLVTEKEKAYGSAFDKAGDFLKVLYPDGIKPEQYKDMLCIVRVFDKLMRIATSYEGTEEKKVEAYSDLMGYGLLGLRASLAEIKQQPSEHLGQEDNSSNKEKPFSDKVEQSDEEEAKNLRWATLAFPKPEPIIGEELAKQLRKQDKEDLIRGPNRPAITPHTAPHLLKRHDNY